MSTVPGSLPSPPDSCEMSSPPKQDAAQESSTQASSAYATSSQTTPSQQQTAEVMDTEQEDNIPRGSAARSKTTGQFLEYIAEQILDISLNLKDHTHPILIRHMSPDFRGKHDALPQVSNRADHTSSLKAHLDKQPNFHVSVLNSSSEVDDSRGRATVYVWYAISGLEHGLKRECVAVFTWERKQGTWMIVKHSGMRGPAGFL